MNEYTFAELRTAAKQDDSGLLVKRVAILGDTATQYLAKAIRGQGILSGLDLSIHEADYDQVDLQLSDPGSDLHAFDADVVFVYQDVTKLRDRFYNTPLDDRNAFSEQRLEAIRGYFTAATSGRPRDFVYCTFPVVNDEVYGSLGPKLEHSLPYQLRQLNLDIMRLAASHANFHICDLGSLITRVGLSQSLDRRMYVNADTTMSLSFVSTAAKYVVDVILATSGRVRKCLIVDLDNTLWGGVIGDDGVANIQLGSLGIGRAFTELQLWIRELVQRGVILAVCSKNTESVAREPFEEHPDMILRMDDVAVFVANWNNKPDNIRHIQSILNIGFDSMVFLDDNPFERNMVRENLPQVTVPELPDDAADYLPYLQTLNLFETVSYSANDRNRTKQYQDEAKRAVAQQSFTNEGDYLCSLEMKSVVAPFSKFTTPRVAQLCQRSNQFNLRTIRYTEKEIEQIAQSEDYLTLSFTLQDKFGDNGLIGVSILKRLSAEAMFVDTWIMSCRVLKRTMEQFMLNRIVDISRSAGYTQLIGEYLPTDRNVIVANHYAELGFTSNDSKWFLPLDRFEARATYVTEVCQ